MIAISAAKVERQERKFNLDGLNKAEALNSPRINFEEPIAHKLVEPRNAANKFYDKHFCQAFDKFK